MSGDKLTVAMDNTFDVMLIDRLQGRIGKFINVVQATESDIRRRPSDSTSGESARMT